MPPPRNILRLPDDVFVCSRKLREVQDGCKSVNQLCLCQLCLCLCLIENFYISIEIDAQC